MGFGEILSDLYSLVTFTDVYAEAPPPAEAKDSEEAQEGGEEKEEKGGEGGESSEDGTDSEAVGGGEAEEKEEGAEGEEKAEEEEEEEEEAEEEEPEDIKPKLEEGMHCMARCSVIYQSPNQCCQLSPSFKFTLRQTHLLRPILISCPFDISSHIYQKY